jgi:hypothetical protein
MFVCSSSSHYITAVHIHTLMHEPKVKSDKTLVKGMFGASATEPISLVVLGVVLDTMYALCTEEALGLTPVVMSLCEEGNVELAKFEHLCEIYVSKVQSIIRGTERALSEGAKKHFLQTLARSREFALKLTQSVHAAILAAKIMDGFNYATKCIIAKYCEANTSSESPSSSLLSHVRFDHQTVQKQVRAYFQANRGCLLVPMHRVREIVAWLSKVWIHLIAVTVVPDLNNFQSLMNNSDHFDSVSTDELYVPGVDNRDKLKIMAKYLVGTTGLDKINDEKTLKK